MVNWVHRPKGFYKLNTDRADKGNPGLAGAGTIIRDAKGDIIATFFANMGFQTNNYAEAYAIYYGLQLCYSLDIQDLHIETDSLLLSQWT